MLPQKKLYFAIALAGLLALGFMTTSVISYFIAHESLSGRIADEALPLTSNNIYSEIEQDLLRSVLISSLMAHDTFVRDWTLDGERDPQQIIRYLREIQNKHGTTTAFFVSDETRNYYHPDGILTQVSADNPGDAWYFRVREMNDPYEINVDADTADRSRLTIFVNYRVTDYNGNYIGATGIGLSVRSVAELIENYQQRYGREIYFVDREGNVTLHGEDFEGVERLQDWPGLRERATRILANPSASVSYARPDDGRTVYVNSRLIPEFDWYLIVQQPESRAEAWVLNTLFLNMGIALAITVLVGVIGWMTVRGYQDRLEKMASTDALTGSASRQVFGLIFDHVTRTARRRNTPLSLLAIDIDDFKQINDERGHAAGDTILYTLAGIFREHLRETDTVCRWGGDEFVILLTDCGLDDAGGIAEKIRTTVADAPIRHGRHEFRVTLSIGAVEQQNYEGLSAVIARADDAMYESKRQGRDRVTLG